MQGFKTFRVQPLLFALLGAVCAYGSAEAQVISPAKPLVIGYLSVTSKKGNEQFYSAFIQGLKEYGWIEGSAFHIEGRWADSQPAMLESLAKDIAASGPRLIVAAPSNSVQMARKVFPDLPIVQANGPDPVTTGLTSSLSRPDRMVTGLSNEIYESQAKSLEMLVRAAAVRRIGFLYEPREFDKTILQNLQRSATRYKVRAQFAAASTSSDIEKALAELKSGGAEGLVILSGSFFPGERQRILRIALGYNWPVVGNLREYAEAGGLLSYGADRKALYRRAAYFVDRLLKGAMPRDLPFEQPPTFELVINLKTANQLGIKLPDELLVRADVVLR